MHGRDDDDPSAPPDGPSASALLPYGASRLAPSFDLVDTAREIALADERLATAAQGKLEILARQIRALQDEARTILARTRRDAELHRVPCRFEKVPGGVYHLYRQHADGALAFSLLGPDEWLRPRPQDFVGSFRLEADRSFTPLEDAERRDRERDAAADALGLLPRLPRG